MVKRFASSFDGFQGLARGRSNDNEKRKDNGDDDDVPDSVRFEPAETQLGIGPSVTVCRRENKFRVVEARPATSGCNVPFQKVLCDLPRSPWRWPIQPSLTYTPPGLLHLLVELPANTREPPSHSSLGRSLVGLTAPLVAPGVPGVDGLVALFEGDLEVDPVRLLVTLLLVVGRRRRGDH